METTGPYAGFEDMSIRGGVFGPDADEVGGVFDGQSSDRILTDYFDAHKQPPSTQYASVARIVLFSGQPGMPGPAKCAGGNARKKKLHVRTTGLGRNPRWVLNMLKLTGSPRPRTAFS